MELNSEHFHAIIFCNFRRGLAAQQCIDELNSIIDYEVASRTGVYRWSGEFNQGRSSFQDEFPETVIALGQLILQDRHVTYREIETT